MRIYYRHATCIAEKGATVEVKNSMVSGWGSMTGGNVEVGGGTHVNNERPCVLFSL